MTAERLTAIVVLRDGKRVSWKIARGAVRAEYLSDKYFGSEEMRPHCTVETATFRPDGWDEASAWCRTFDRHPEAPPGFEP